jgi:chaperonin cofactor prefoldin
MIKKKKEITLESLDIRMDRLDARIDRLDARMDKLDKKIDKLDASIRKVGIEVEKLSHGFMLFIESYASLSERTEKVEDRVSVLEGKRA